MQCKGAEIVIRCLLEQGVDTVFGYPGGTILDVYDALYAHKKEIRHIRTSHEQGAAHAADGYARATGRAGVCFATSGPGSTNLVTGLATAFMDSIPVVAITCNVTKPLLGKDSFQEVDIAGVSTPVTKHSVIVKEISHLAPAIRRAFRIAMSGRRGPVLVDITKDVTQLTGTYEEVPKVKGNASKKTWDAEKIAEIVSMIGASEKPFLYIGGGAVSSGASRVLKTFIEKMDAPFCVSLMGKGAADERSPYYTGMIGMHGTKASNRAASECDLLLALGARFADRVTGKTETFASKAKIIHLDIDAAEINKNVRADVSVCGDLKQVLTALNAALKQQHHPAWNRYVRELSKRFPLSFPKGRLTGPKVIQKLYALTKGEAIITTDVGQHQMWAAQYYPCHRPRTFLTSGGLGTMGYGLGACIGAKAAFPEKRCINITGDGCFRMNMQELMTAADYALPVMDIIFDNRTLGMVRQWQTLFYNRHYSATNVPAGADYCKIAEGMGCEAYRAETEEELDDVFRKAFRSKKPVVIDCLIDTDDAVFPMVPAGKSIAEAFDENDLKRKRK